MTTKTTISAIKDYFSTPGKPVTMTELKALSRDERADLAEQVFAVTGWEKTPS